MSTYDYSFSNFGRSLVPDDLCKDSAPRHSRFWRRRFLKVFTIYGHGGHLGQRTAKIFAIFCFPTLRWLHMQFEQNWLRGSRGEVVWNSQQFFPFKCMGRIQMHRERTWPCRKKVKRQRTTILLATLVDLPSLMIRDDSAPRHPRRRRWFLKVLTIYGHGGHLGQRNATILALFRSPTLRRLHMKFEENWPSGFRGEVVWKC